MTKPISFQEKLAMLKPLIWKEVERLLPTDKNCHHCQMVREYPIRQGKYLRPALFLIALEMFGVEWQNHVELAACLQLCEDWLLVHDDIEDQSYERRGRPSLNKMYGDFPAINAGDALHLLMWEGLVNYCGGINKLLRKDVFGQIIQMLKTTLEGQSKDLCWIKNSPIDLSYKSYFQMVKEKTCTYTTTGPITLAGIIAGLDANNLKQLKLWTEPFGYSFQIQDDIMDIETDLAEGKYTLLFLHVVQKCNDTEKESIIKIYLKSIKKRTENDVLTVQRLFKKYNSIEYTRNKALEFSKIAQNEFKKFCSDINYSAALSIMKEAIEFAVTRDH